MAEQNILFTLPPELRLEIYRYVLLRPSEEARVVPTIRKRLSTEAKHRRATALAEGRLRLPVSIQAALLCVNKQISQEACPVLYESHRFILRTAQGLDHFLINIGDNKHHLRRIEVSRQINSRSLPAIGRISDNLVNTKGLRSLYLQFGRFYAAGRVDQKIDMDDYLMERKGCTPSAFIEKFVSVGKKLLLALHHAQKSDKKVAKKVLNIFILHDLHSGLGTHARKQVNVALDNAVERLISENDR
jgi:hypothetical protein